MEFEELTGLDITEAEHVMQLGKIKNMRALAFVGLKHGAKAESKPFDVTLEQVGDWLDTGMVEIFSDLFGAATGSGTSTDDVDKKKLHGETSEQSPSGD